MVGDVRDRDRLVRAAKGADVVIHAAAMKQVPACEYNPFEAVQTNVIGAENVVDAAIDAEVPVVVGLSIGQGREPRQPLRRHEALCGEDHRPGQRLRRRRADASSAAFATATSWARGEASSPLFRRQRETGELTITDERMTRFWITLGESVELVLHAVGHGTGGEVFVPKIPSMRIVDLAEAIAPGHTPPRSSASVPARSSTSRSSPPTSRATPSTRRPVRRPARVPLVAQRRVGRRQAARGRLRVHERDQRPLPRRRRAASDAPVIPYGRQSIDDADIAAVVDVLHSDWLSQGPVGEEFEAALAAEVGATPRRRLQQRHRRPPRRGRRCRPRSGRRRWRRRRCRSSASASCALYVGATPRLVDIDPCTLNLDPAPGPAGSTPSSPSTTPGCRSTSAGSPSGRGSSSRTPPTRSGRQRRTDPSATALAPICACFSFHPVKAITTGEGGAVTTNSDELADATATVPAPRHRAPPRRRRLELRVETLGFNYRLSDIHAALGLSQLGQARPSFVARRRERADRYRAAFDGTDVVLPPDAPPGWRPRPTTSSRYACRGDARSSTPCGRGHRRAGPLRASAPPPTARRGGGSGRPLSSDRGGVRRAAVAAAVSRPHRGRSGPRHHDAPRPGRRATAAQPSGRRRHIRSTARQSGGPERRRSSRSGTQTFSKAPTQFVAGRHADLPVPRARAPTCGTSTATATSTGPMALGPVLLGYAEPAVDEAIRRQLGSRDHLHPPAPARGRGRRAHRRHVPGRRGGPLRQDRAPTRSTAAVRAARALTGRDVVLVVRLPRLARLVHRHDASAPKACPAAVRALTATFASGDLADLQRAFDEHDGEVAAVVAGALGRSSSPRPATSRASSIGHGRTAPSASSTRSSPGSASRPVAPASATASNPISRATARRSATACRSPPSPGAGR